MGTTQHLFLERDQFGNLTVKLLCLECGRAFWVSEDYLDDPERRATCPSCRHRAKITDDQSKVLR